MSKLTRLAQITVTVGMLIFLARVADLGALWDLIRAADWRFLLAAVVISVGDRLTMFGKWYPLLIAQWRDAPFWPAARIYIASGLAQYVLPVSVGADVLRSASLGTARGKVHEVAASVVAERLLGLLAAGLMSGVAITVAIRASIDMAILLPWAALSIGVTVVAAGVPLTPWGTRKLAKWTAVGRSGRIVNSLLRFAAAYNTYRGHAKMLGIVAVLSVVEQWFPIFMFLFVAKGLGVVVTLEMCVVAIPLAVFVGRLPISFGGIGVAESAILYVLTLFNLPLTDALAVSVVARAIDIFVVATPGLFLWPELVRFRRLREAVADQPAIVL